MVRAVLLASGNPSYQKVQDWISESWQKATMEELSDPGGNNMVMLDLKIADGMVTMLNKGGEKAKRA